MFWIWSIQQDILFTDLVKYYFLYLKLLISQSKLVGLLKLENESGLYFNVYYACNKKGAAVYGCFVGKICLDSRQLG